MLRHPRAKFLAWFLFAAVGAVACGAGTPPPQYLGGTAVEAAQVETHPEILLPGGAIALAQGATKGWTASEAGPLLNATLRKHLPVGSFDPAALAEEFLVGSYASQGPEVLVIMRGKFSVEALRREARATPTTGAGMKVLESQYAGLPLFIAGKLAWMPLTDRLVLFGTEALVRRSLDRLRNAQVASVVEPWMLEAAKGQEVDVAIAADLSSPVMAKAAVAEVPMAKGVKSVQVVGRLVPTGIDAAGTATYESVDGAKAAAQQLNDTKQMGLVASAVLFALGLGGLPDVEAEAKDTRVTFKASLDKAWVPGLARLFDQALDGYVRE